MQLRHLLPVCVLGLGCAWPVLSQEKPAAPAGVLVVAQKEKAAKKPSPRLPNNYGKLELGDDQRNAIYALQAKYNGQIDALKEQIAALKEKRDADIEAVLNPAQKQKLKTLLDAAAKKKGDQKAPPAEAEKNEDK